MTLRVLIVDDEKSIREMYKIELTYFFPDLHVDLVDDGEEALKVADEQSYNLIITDGKMPKVGGVELAIQLHKKDLNIPVIMITGYVNEFKANEHGELFTHIFDKPVDFEVLVEAVSNILNIKPKS